jgi:hypothetical protein
MAELAAIRAVTSLMLTANKRRRRLEDAFMGVTLERGVAYQFDLAGATWTGTWTGERDVHGTPMFARFDDPCRLVPRGAAWFGRLSEVAALDSFALGDGMVSCANPYVRREGEGLMRDASGHPGALGSQRSWSRERSPTDVSTH